MPVISSNDNVYMTLQTRRARLLAPAPEHTRPTALRRKAEAMAKLCRGLSDPSRLSILEALRSGALAVGEIVESTGLA